jgi:hypothetical protein
VRKGWGWDLGRWCGGSVRNDSKTKNYLAFVIEHNWMDSFWWPFSIWALVLFERFCNTRRDMTSNVPLNSLSECVNVPSAKNIKTLYYTLYRLFVNKQHKSTLRIKITLPHKPNGNGQLHRASTVEKYTRYSLSSNVPGVSNTRYNSTRYNYT